MLGWHRRLGRAEGRAATRLEMVREILRARGIAVPDQGLARAPEIDVTSDDAVVRAAFACNDETDFLARLRRSRTPS
jgi:hypothetical protein